MEPLVSVIMPVYNGEKFISEAVQSIIGQSYNNWEIVAINDASTDSSVEILKEFNETRIRIYENESNKGISYSRNRAIDLAKGKYIALMDNDDVSLPDRLSEQANYMENHEDIDVLSGANKIIDEKGELVQEITYVLKNPKYIKAKLLFENVFYNGTTMIRKAKLDEYNIRYRNNQYGMEDYRFWVECSKKMNMTSIDSFIYKHRLHSDNETKKNKSQSVKEREKCYFEIQKFSLEQSGFKLEENDYEVIFNVLKEGSVTCENKENVDELTKVFNKIVNQARTMKMNNVEEIEILCKQKICKAIRSCCNYFI